MKLHNFRVPAKGTAGNQIILMYVSVVRLMQRRSHVSCFEQKERVVYIYVFPSLNNSVNIQQCPSKEISLQRSTFCKAQISPYYISILWGVMLNVFLLCILDTDPTLYSVDSGFSWDIVSEHIHFITHMKYSGIHDGWYVQLCQCRRLDMVNFLIYTRVNVLS